MMKILDWKLIFLLLIPGISTLAQSADSSMISAATALIDLSFSDAKKDSMLEGVKDNLDLYRQMHRFNLSNDQSCAFSFHPAPVGFAIPQRQVALRWNIPADVPLPANRDALAFYSIPQLASLIRSRKISSVELTRFFLSRLKKWGDTLKCVVSLTEDIALREAAAADRDLAKGIYKGPLHGIPYGLKDLFAVKGTRTTWGARPFREQALNDNAYVYTRLHAAGAVLCAKLSMGALAMGDVWFGGITRNPWNLEQGSSGSSAGSAAATAAGLLPFAIGTETLGSIVSPSARCGATGLRPTFGSVSRSGAMTLGWSLDKIGPICRSAEDAAIVFYYIRGTDGRDPSAVNRPFNYTDSADFKKLRVAYAANYFSKLPADDPQRAVIATFRQLGARVQEVVFPDSAIYPVNIISPIISAECAAAFDAFTRSGLDDALVRQDRNAWPNQFRVARLVPAVEYINANRHRARLIADMYDFMKNYDIVIVPSFAGHQLSITNLTGYPVVCLPAGFAANGSPLSITLLGNLYDEATLLTAAKAFQDRTDFNKRHPAMFSTVTAAGKQPADLIIYNAVIYTVDAGFSKAAAMAIKAGKIIATGTSESILGRYTANTVTDMHRRYIYPGLIDAHAHFFHYGLGLNTADLTGTDSWESVITILKKFSAGHPYGWLTGRGWDQNRWPVKEFPSNAMLDTLFPDRPVLLSRIDGHAAIANSRALQLAGLYPGQQLDGGVIETRNGRLTGILIDNAVDLVGSKIPPPDAGAAKQALLKAAQNCFAVGLTTVDDCGLDFSEILLMDSLQQAGELKMRVYAMLGDARQNYDFIFRRGKIKTDRLNVRAFKLYADGALGSRGACLLKPYADRPGWTGFLLSNPAHFDSVASLLYSKGLQVCTHAIGDSGNRIILNIYARLLKGKNDLRWRIEHAQVVDPADLRLFGSNSIIPSVQPSHATSDMYWAEKRLGSGRIKSAYAYRQLLKENGWIALGTDFPVEDISPFKTFYAAAVRRDAKGWPSGGFQPENALSRRDALRGMTIWAARANFEEAEKGSLEKGKFADFVVTDNDLMTVPAGKILSTSVIATYVNGEKVYEK